jgi:hypothetical protein
MLLPQIHAFCVKMILDSAQVANDVSHQPINCQAGRSQKLFYQISFNLLDSRLRSDIDKHFSSGVEAFIQNRQFQLFIILYIPSQQLYLSTH